MRAKKGEASRQGNDVNKNRVEATKLLIGFIVLKCGRYVLSFEETMDIVYSTMGRRKGE